MISEISWASATVRRLSAKRNAFEFLGEHKLSFFLVQGPWRNPGLVPQLRLRTVFQTLVRTKFSVHHGARCLGGCGELWLSWTGKEEWTKPRPFQTFSTIYPESPFGVSDRPLTDMFCCEQHGGRTRPAPASALKLFHLVGRDVVGEHPIANLNTSRLLFCIASAQEKHCFWWVFFCLLLNAETKTIFFQQEGLGAMHRIHLLFAQFIS